MLMEKNILKYWVLCLLIFMAFLACREGDKQIYLDPEQSIEKRIDDLLSRMTLLEKVGQLNMPCVYERGLGKEVSEKLEACKKFTEGTFITEIGPGGGFFTLANTILPDGPRQQAEYFNELQKIALEKTRLGIPLLQTEEGTHGLMCSGGTIFPEGLGIGSTWDMDLVEDIYTVAAREARAVGIHQLFTLVIEPIRDPRLGRNEEAYTEDPFLSSCIAEAIVRGTQGEDISTNDRVVTGFCHYPGQSEPVSGLERGAMEISERKLREVFLPPWVAGIKKCGALGVMATYPAIDNLPTHASKKILTDILRGELQFDGLVLGEGGGISTLVYEGVAADQKEAGILALRAGVDVGISFEEGYMGALVESINEGKVSKNLLDRSVRRVLKQKFRLGLFEKSYVDVNYAVKVSHTEEHQDLALKTAREGIILLKNENKLLPLKREKIKSIAVIGPNADHERNQLGDYIAHNILQNIVTVLEGIKNEVSSQAKIEYVKGCNVTGTDLNEISKAKAAAKRADVAIIVVGENERRGPDGTDGEGRDISSLDLTGMQEDLVKAVHSTGTPTIVILINGRPLSIRWIAENIPAILEAWNCGEKGGDAIADIIFGEVNPSGRLPISVPRHVGQLPVYYNYSPSKAVRMRAGYVDRELTPLYEFGYGLSYTTFEYRNLQITPAEIEPAGTVRISIDVQNTGDRTGSEVVQLYINDVLSSLTTPVKELKGFEKITLEPGQTKNVTFTVSSDQLSFLNINLEPVVEPGTFEVMVGASSQDIRIKGSFQVVNL
jgi:beta-glucosidase